MANYYDRDDEGYRENERFARGYGNGRNRGERYGGAYERERGWETGREEPSRYGTGWPEDYERGYSSRYYTGDDQGRGFAGGRDFGRSYTPSYERGFNETPSSERGYSRPDFRSRNSEGRFAREYQGTNRPPDYGRDYQASHSRNYRGEGLAGERDWFDRASDEVSSWFGDEDAERRRRMDKVHDGKYRGRGPKGYRRSDERIKEDVSDRLAEHAYLDASDIEVAVKDGEVILSGTVTHRRDKRAAEDLAEDVSGVKNVQNNLRVSEIRTPSTAGLATAPNVKSASTS
jgi:osmotically-inducible protein OsmY